MKICPNCNASVPDVAKFCPKCRFNIKKYEDEQVNTVLYCMECGAEIVEGASFCMECGADVVSGDSTSLVLNNNEEKINLDALNGINNIATEQLYEQNGLKVENGVLTAYTGKKSIVTVFGSIEEIFASAFENNDFVTHITIEEGVKAIGKRAFANCSFLEEVTIPASCKKIFDDAFDGTKLNTLILTEINEDIIKICLTEMGLKYYDSEKLSKCVTKSEGQIKVDIKKIEIESKKAKEERIKDCFDIQNGVLVKYKLNEVAVQIPNCITSIGKYAFKNCKKLKSIEIPNSVTTIGNSAFHSCTNLKSIKIPNSVTTINGYAFFDNTNLTSVEVPNSTTTIGNGAFKNCKSLKSIRIPNSITTIGGHMFECCENLTSIEVPNSVTTIDANAFAGCTNLTSIKLPNSLTTIGYGAFANCTNLTSIKLPNSLTTIGYGAFMNCTNLKTIKMSRKCKCDDKWKCYCDAEVIYID